MAHRRDGYLFVIFLLSDRLTFRPNPTYSLVGLRDRKQTAIRYTDSQADRLAAAAEFKGLPMQAFQLHAVTRAIEEAEAEMNKRKAKRQANTQSVKPSGVVGLGLFQNRAPEPVQVERPPAASPPVIVNVGTDRSSDGMIERLARRILEAPAHEQDRRKREAAVAIQAFAANEDEQRSMTEKLAAEISRKTDSGKSESIWNKLTGGSLDRFTKGIV